MARAKKEVYKDWVRKVVASLREYFYFEAWHIDLLWEENDDGVDGCAGVVAHIGINSDYLEAVIHFLPTAEVIFDAGDVERLAFAIVHEFCHILTEPLYDIAWDAVSPAAGKYLQTIREQQTQRIALAVFRGIPEELYSL